MTDVGRRTGTTICICGEMAGDPLHAPVLLGLGFQELSLLPQNIPPVKSMLRSLKATETRSLIDELMTYTSAKDIVTTLHSRYGGILDADDYLEGT